MRTFLTNSPEQTMHTGRKLAACLGPDMAIALSGDLGSGKTTFVKGIAAGLGIDPSQVNSPSFVLIKEYAGKRLPLFHCDLYRLEGLSQIATLGLDDYFLGGGVFVIEWAAKAQELLPKEYLHIDMKFLAKQKRKIIMRAKGERYRRLLEDI